MSDAPEMPVPAPPPEPQAPKRRSPWRHVARAAVLAVVVVVAAASAVFWYASTPAFENKVRGYVVATLEQTTGGRVELGAFRWRLLRLQVEADNLTIHGLEGPDEVPYAHVDHIFVRATIISFISAKVGLKLFTADRPVVHLILYSDGTTNQPRPKTERNGKPLNDTLLDMAIDHAEITDGLVLVNQRAIPFNVAADDVGLVVNYVPATVPGDRSERYQAQVSAADVATARGSRPEVHSKLTANIEFARNGLNLSSVQLQTGESMLHASGTLSGFQQPHWTVTADGSVDMREVEALAAISGVERGVAQLSLKGQGEPGAFQIDGNVKVAGAAYRTSGVQVSGVQASTNLRATQDELALTGMRVRLAEGGAVEGDLQIFHWLASTPAPTSASANRTRQEARAAVAANQQRGSIRATVTGVTLRSLMRMVAPPRYRDLGFNTAASGRTNIDWVGSASDLTVQAVMRLQPAGRGAAGDVPLSGSVNAKYFNRSGTVLIQNVQIETPGTQATVQGVLGVYPAGRASQLHADLTTNNLGEFDRTLAALGVSENGRSGVWALPVQLQGQAEFHGTVSGTMSAPDVKGHLIATNFDTVYALGTPPQQAGPAAEEAAPPQNLRSLHWDRLDAQAEYSPQVVSIDQATLTHGSTAIHASGSLHAHEIARNRYAFDDDAAVHANLTVQNAPLADVLTAAGSSAPVSGTVNLHAMVGGELGNLSGGGHLSVLGGTAWDEPYRSLNADLNFSGRELGVRQLTLLQNGGRVTGDGGYDLGARRFHFKAQGRGFDLAHIQHLQRNAAVNGLLTFDASGQGTLDDPELQAQVHLSKLSMSGQSLGEINANAHTDQHALLYTADSALDRATLHVDGHTELKGDYNTHAQITLTHLDVDPYLQLSGIRGLTAKSAIGGVAMVDGPLRHPKQMNGEVTIQEFTVALAGVPLRSDGNLHARLQHGILQLDPLHITGDDTNLRAQGTVDVIGSTHALRMHANGAVNLKIAQTFNPQIISSGHVDFTMDGSGTVQNPDLTGHVRFTNVALALQDVPNGLSQINGTLEFDQDRLEVKDLTATTGGGQLKLGGFLTYRQGLYGDLTATGKDIRIRYPQGISSVADAKLRLQGTEQNLLLNGTVLLTRFAINPNLDFAALSASSSSVSPPPDPDAPASHLRLDVHIISSPELNFQNSYAKLAGDVDLRVRGTAAQPSVLGHISITEGSATFAGTQYQLQHGDIYFTNPVTIEPIIDLDATARVETYDLTVGLHGTPSKLQFTYRSEPPLPQADIFALLALGRTQEEQQIYSQQQQQAGVNSTANALLSGALNATVSNRIERLFGGGSVKIDPTFVGTLGNSTARITVEQQVASNTTLTYATNVNSTAQQLIQAEINLTRTVSLVAQRDESGVFSVVVKVHKRAR